MFWLPKIISRICYPNSHSALKYGDTSDFQNQLQKGKNLLIILFLCKSSIYCHSIAVTVESISRTSFLFQFCIMSLQVIIDHSLNSCSRFFISGVIMVKVLHKLLKNQYKIFSALIQVN